MREHPLRFRERRALLPREQGVLAERGFELSEAESGPMALALIEANRPDLVILDLALPGLDGFEVARRLRDLPALAGLPIIASSASVDEAQQRRAKDAGCDEFLPKPVRLPALFEVLGRRLDLTWIRAPRVVAEAIEEPAAPRIEPSAEVLARLLDLADRGRIPELLQDLQRLKQRTGDSACGQVKCARWPRISSSVSFAPRSRP